MSVATAERPSSHHIVTPTVKSGHRAVNVLSPQLQQRWRDLGYRAQRTQAVTNWMHSLSWIVGGVIAFVAFSTGVSLIGWGLFGVFESNGWIGDRELGQGALLVAAIVLSTIIWFRICTSLVVLFVRMVERTCRKREDSHHLKVNDWWQKVDRELRVQNRPGVNRPMCTVGSYAVLEDRRIVRVEENSVVNGRVTDGVWLVAGWNRPLVRDW